MLREAQLIYELRGLHSNAHSRCTRTLRHTLLAASQCSLSKHLFCLQDRLTLTAGSCFWVLPSQTNNSNLQATYTRPRPAESNRMGLTNILTTSACEQARHRSRVDPIMPPPNTQESFTQPPTSHGSSNFGSYQQTAITAGSPLTQVPTNTQPAAIGASCPCNNNQRGKTFALLQEEPIASSTPLLRSPVDLMTTGLTF